MMGIYDNHSRTEYTTKQLDAIPDKYSEVEKRFVYSFAKDYNVTIYEILKYIDIKGVLPPINLGKYSISYDSKVKEFRKVLDDDDFRIFRIKKIDKLRKNIKYNFLYKLKLKFKKYTNVFKCK